jgi:hypothetical protein
MQKAGARLWQYGRPRGSVVFDFRLVPSCIS